MRTLPLVLLLAVLAAGCSPDPPEPEVKSTTTHTPEELGRIGAQIDSDPKAADDVLEQAGTNEQRFEQAIRELSADEEAAGEYSSAFEKEKAKKSAK